MRRKCLAVKEQALTGKKQNIHWVGIAMSYGLHLQMMTEISVFLFRIIFLHGLLWSVVFWPVPKF